MEENYTDGHRKKREFIEFSKYQLKNIDFKINLVVKKGRFEFSNLQINQFSNQKNVR